MLKMPKTKWLHISDIHMNKRGVDNRRMRQKLLEYLRENDIQCDYVFFTGDLRYAPEGDFDPTTVSFFKELCNSVGAKLENLFIVPGNHDIERDDPTRTKAIDAVCGADGYYNARTGVIQNEDIQCLKAGRAGWYSIVEKLYANIPERIHMYEAPDILHFCVRTEHFNIIHLDSVITYAKQRQRDLIVGTEQLLDVFSEADPTKTTIILTHYSYDFLDRSEQKIVQSLMADYNVQLWLAGHEHDDLLRKQRDYFYEFQCGNLIHENGETRSCVAVGEFDTEQHKGNVQVFYWDSPNGWAVDAYISQEKDRSRYNFALQDAATATGQVASIVQSEEFRRISEDTVVFNLNKIDKDIIRKLEKSEMINVRSQLGTRLSGNETAEKVMDMFMNEVKMTLNSNKRHECMPLFQHVIRDVYEGYMYLDGNFAPFLKVSVRQFYFENMDWFWIYSDSFELLVTTEEHQVVGVDYQYNLSRYEDVEERLYHFGVIRQYQSAHDVFVKMVGHEVYNLSFEVTNNEAAWQENLENTAFWIEEMRWIAEIEQYYGVKFKLPLKALEEEHFAIDILHSSIHNESCRILPVLPMHNPGLRRHLKLEEEIYMDHAAELQTLQLFGYVFRPIAQYILPGDYTYSKQKKGWETRSENQIGVPVRVEFEVRFDEERNKKMTQLIPFDKARQDISMENIVQVSGETQAFFERFIQVTHDVQEVFRLFLAYKDQLERMQEYSLISWNEKKKTEAQAKIADQITANEVTNNVAAAGRVLVERMDHVIEYLGIKNEDYFSPLWMGDHIGYIWLISMKRYANDGHFPVSVDNNGEYYYDYPVIEYGAKQYEKNDFLNLIQYCRDSFTENGSKTGHIEHYNVMRNFMFEIADKLHVFYETIKETMLELSHKMTCILAEHPELIVQQGKFSGYVVYSLEKDPDYIHAFREDEDVMLEYYKCANEIERHLEDCQRGCNKWQSGGY